MGCIPGHFALEKAKGQSVSLPTAFPLCLPLSSRVQELLAACTAASFTVQPLNLCQSQTISPIYLKIGSYGSILTWRGRGGWKSFVRDMGE